MAKTNSKAAARKSSTPKQSTTPRGDRGTGWDLLESRLVGLAFKFAAIRRLAPDIEAHDLAERQAALQGVDSMALLGALEADAIIRSLGHEWVGTFEKEANALAGVGEMKAARTVGRPKGSYSAGEKKIMALLVNLVATRNGVTLKRAARAVMDCMEGQNLANPTRYKTEMGALRKGVARERKRLTEMGAQFAASPWLIREIEKRL